MDVPHRPRAKSLVRRGSQAAESDSESQPHRSRLDSFRSRKRSGSVPPSSYAPSNHAASQEEVLYPHVTVFRDTSRMEIHLRSPFVKMARPPGYEAVRSLPVYDVHNKVQGIIRLDGVICSVPGRLSVTIEGAFVYIAPPVEAVDRMRGKATAFGMHRHIFLHETRVLPVENSFPQRRSNSSLREAIANVRPCRVERRPSGSNIKGGMRSFPFTFDIPPPNRMGEELPQTFCSVIEGMSGTRGRTSVERAEVVYKVTAIWESDLEDQRLSVEAPIIFEPERDFESLDGRSLETASWVEIPLRSDRPITFTCAIAIPDTPSMPRASSIPLYVVFTTKPRSPSLAHEILADATITVSLTRQVNIDTIPISPSATSLQSPNSPSSSSSSHSVSGSENDVSSYILQHKTRLMKRMVNSAPPILSRRKLKLPAHLPPVGVRTAEVDRPEGFSGTRTLYTDVCVGFPKRPRIRVEPGQHPPLNALAQLPDGLYKSKLQLNKHMIPSINWGDLSVKYYLEVSVLFGQDESRARIPTHII